MWKPKFYCVQQQSSSHNPIPQIFETETMTKIKTIKTMKKNDDKHLHDSAQLFQIT